MHKVSIEVRHLVEGDFLVFALFLDDPLEVLGVDKEAQKVNDIVKIQLEVP